MKYPLLALTLLLLSSCGNNATVFFGMYSRYKLQEGEVNHHPIPKEKVDEFEACCYMEGAQIYLNRAFTYPSQNYRVFIGAGEQLHSSEFSGFQSVDDHYLVKESKSFTGKKVQFDAFLLQRDDFSICRVVFDEPKSGLLLVVDHVFTSSNQAKGFFEGLEQNFEQYIKLK